MGHIDTITFQLNILLVFMLMMMMIVKTTSLSVVFITDDKNHTRPASNVLIVILHNMEQKWENGTEDLEGGN